MFNAYLISTLKFQFEKNYKFNYITSAMFYAYKRGRELRSYGEGWPDLKPETMTKMDAN